MLALVPSNMVMVPELVPSLVLSTRSPVPLVVIVALALLSPTLTVSAFNCKSPVPLGVIAMALLVLLPTMLSILKSPASVSSPELGLKVNLVLDTLMLLALPVVTSSNSM